MNGPTIITTGPFDTKATLGGSDLAKLVTTPREAWEAIEPIKSVISLLENPPDRGIMGRIAELLSSAERKRPDDVFLIIILLERYIERYRREKPVVARELLTFRQITIALREWGPYFTDLPAVEVQRSSETPESLRNSMDFLVFDKDAVLLTMMERLASIMRFKSARGINIYDTPDPDQLSLIQSAGKPFVWLNLDDNSEESLNRGLVRARESLDRGGVVVLTSNDVGGAEEKLLKELAHYDAQRWMLVGNLLPLPEWKKIMEELIARNVKK